MSEEVKEENVVHFRDGSRNPVIEIGSKSLLNFFRQVAKDEGFASDSLRAVQLIVEGKPLMTLPKIVIMVSNVVDNEVESEPEGEKQTNGVSVERTVDIKLPRGNDFAVDDTGFYSKPQTAEQLAALPDEEFERVCEQYAYTPEEKKDDNG